MPSREAAKRAKEDKKEGKPATTQAGEFVREEMHALKEGKGAARSRKQAVAIGLSEARRSGVDLKPPKKGSASPKTRKKAENDLKKGTQRKDR